MGREPYAICQSSRGNPICTYRRFVCSVRLVMPDSGWTYEFVGHKQRYSKLFLSLAVEQALGSTAAHSARMQQAPTSTVQRLHQEAGPQISEQMQAKAWAAAKTMTGFVLGVDDFAIKKGHTYNTGIHNLRGETMLDLLPGRKLEDLRPDAAAHPDFRHLCPKAVVMDLAQVYHTWISECFILVSFVSCDGQQPAFDAGFATESIKLLVQC